MKTLRQTFDLHLPRLEKAIHDSPWEDRAFYSLFLVQTYYYVSHSTELLEVAANSSKNLALAKHLKRHKKEETGHERWAEQDAKALGFDPKTFSEFDETKLIYQSVHNEILKVGPAAIMAFAMSLEGLAARTLPEVFKNRIEKLYPDACRFVKGHSIADPHHIEAGFKAAEMLSDEEKQDWNRVFEQCIDRYIGYLAKLKKSSAQFSQKRAA
jgi:thiaminase